MDNSQAVNKTLFCWEHLTLCFCHMYLMDVATWKFSCLHVFGTDISIKSKENKL